MTKETLERLLNEACELLIIFNDSNLISNNDKNRINAIFMELKYSDKINSEMNQCLPLECKKTIITIINKL